MINALNRRFIYLLCKIKRRFKECNFIEILKFQGHADVRLRANHYVHILLCERSRSVFCMFGQRFRVFVVILHINTFPNTIFERDRCSTRSNRSQKTINRTQDGTADKIHPWHSRRIIARAITNFAHKTFMQDKYLCTCASAVIIIVSCVFFRRCSSMQVFDFVSCLSWYEGESAVTRSITLRSCIPNELQCMYTCTGALKVVGKNVGRFVCLVEFWSFRFVREVIEMLFWDVGLIWLLCIF